MSLLITGTSKRYGYSAGWDMCEAISSLAISGSKINLITRLCSNLKSCFDNLALQDCKYSERLLSLRPGIARNKNGMEDGCDQGFQFHAPIMNYPDVYGCRVFETSKNKFPKRAIWSFGNDDHTIVYLDYDLV
ncbi:hypothetical protein PHYBLDRAFT_162328 [Phycomyces blakesleeanus NRRL 1555(-)]|uniref:Uncharacterized protein n=1 Tax=Phycomyces blakesleeanus (strain ATCC 8743b / DSM 1359 / FGSC 10004 / NBRC 33097 / NRRL 1555) TaxID=763407 RepID=A0A163BAI9_PHYB8|nr:hypothetical protein PHYBLDRAFT_162328 [Phycomyces blakesleeanus NRRL 1555(-)]OAD79251.1 hypothetical protein PHYBLDRAFT_162328 [Phycomyces blakesleeanus NRRL 1555(-)]|eukprot:XP_018297291.1 hypothetical protein PHYBLDRAFT_162328 [Phycomyces blakesleeanus NRRL 1555(-)]